MQGILENMIFSFVDLVRQTLLLGVPVLVVAWVGKKIHSLLSKNRSWLTAAFFSTYILFFLLIMLAYFLPFLIGLGQFQQGITPESLAPTGTDRAIVFVINVFRVALVALVFTVLSLPIEFVGAFLQDLAAKRKTAPMISFGFGVFGSVFISLLLILFILPFIGINLIAGLIYLVYFA